MDSSKLKRHFLSHTGERQFVCQHEGCGKVSKSTFSEEFPRPSHSFHFAMDLVHTKREMMHIFHIHVEKAQLEALWPCSSSLWNWHELLDPEYVYSSY